MCLYELVKRANSCRVSQWTADTDDEILIGDAMYVKAFMKVFDDDTIPDQTRTQSLLGGAQVRPSHKI